MGILKNLVALLDWHKRPTLSAYALVIMTACEKSRLLIVRLSNHMTPVTTRNLQYFLFHRETTDPFTEAPDCILATLASHAYRKVHVRRDSVVCLRFTPRLLRCSSSTAVTLR